MYIFSDGYERHIPNKKEPMEGEPVIYFNNFNVDVTGQGKEMLGKVFALFGNERVEGYRVDAEKGLILYWLTGNPVPDATILPFPMTMQDAAVFTAGWLEYAEYGKEPDHDGHNQKGWRVYTGATYGSIMAVQPVWALYGK